MMEIGAAVTAVKGALDLARSAKDVNDRAQLNAAMSDIMDKLTSAQSDLLELLTEHHRLIEENRELKGRLEKSMRFDNYVLRETPSGGAFIYTLKPELVNSDNPFHVICPQCKEDGILSIMFKYPTYYKCKRCSYLAVHTKSEGPILSAMGKQLL